MPEQPWEESADKTIYTKGHCKIIKKPIRAEQFVYHCYHQNKYVAQRKALADAVSALEDYMEGLEEG